HVGRRPNDGVPAVRRRARHGVRHRDAVLFPGAERPVARVLSAAARRGVPADAPARRACGVIMPVSLASQRDRDILRSYARRIDPSDAGAHNNLGVLYYNKGMYEDAVAAFTKALELDPK